MLSGYNEFEYAKEAIKIGISDYLLKPVSSAGLIDALKKAADEIREEREKSRLLERYFVSYEKYTEFLDKTDYSGVDRKLINDFLKLGSVEECSPFVEEYFAAIGAVFGMTSFLQCIGIGGSSAMGAMLFSINPFLAFVQRFVPRMLDGLLLGYIFQFVRRRTDAYMASLVTGFCSAFLNTVFFMTALVVLFGNTEYMQGLIGGKNIILFVCGFVGINAVCEMVSSTILTGAVGAALYRAKFVPALEKSRG